MLVVKDEDLKELIGEFQALPPEEKPKAIEALACLEKEGVINPPLSDVFLALLEVWTPVQ